MKFRVFSVVGMLGALGVAQTMAQQIPPIESGERIVNARLVNGQLELRDAATNAPICVPRGQQMIDPPTEADIRSTVTVQPQPSGADVIFTFRNMGSQPKPLTRLSVGIFTLGQVVTYHDDYAKLSRPTQVDYETYVGKAYDYPNYLYSPAWVINNDQYAVGVSIQYPMMEYKHDVKVGLSSPWWQPLVNGEGGRGWQVNFMLSNTGPNPWQQVQYQAMLQPDESRTYVVSVRVNKTPSDWIRTLLPYRNFFRATYGGVKYERRTNPVKGIGLSDESMLSADNPRGYNSYWRPDRIGWSRFINSMDQMTQGYDAIMLWLPGGVYYNNRQLNFPCQFSTPWMTSPEMMTIFDNNVGMPGFVRRTGKSLGYWWGQSSRVAADWDPDEMLDLDPDNPERRRLALLELDLGVRAGGDMIGLDTFSHTYCPVWKLYPWLVEMRLRHPHVLFVTEPIVCDVLHTISPTFVSGWNDFEAHPSPDDFYLIRNPNYLADFLLPGHEIWGAFRYNGLRRYFNQEPTAEMVLTDMARYASYGYRPCFNTAPDVPRNSIVAAPTWETTVPADLRLSASPEPFGPVASGSSHVGLGTSSKPQRGDSRATADGDNGSGVMGWRPEKPSSAARRTTVVRSSRPGSSLAAGSPAPTVGAPTLPSAVGTGAARSGAPTRAGVSSVQTASDALRRWREQMAGAIRSQRTQAAPKPAEVANVPTE